jgi:hypothetical protein
MPPLPNVPNTLKVRIKGTISGVPWVNVHYWQYSGAAPSVPTLNSAANVFLSQFATQMAASQSNFVQTTECDISDLSSPLGSVGVAQGTHAGGLSGAFSTSATCMVVSKSILRKYRGGHGRTYLLVGSPAELESPSQWLPAFTTQVATAYIAWINAVSNGGAFSGITNNVIVHYHQNHVLLANPLVDVIQTYTTQPRPGTQRGRLS